MDSITLKATARDSAMKPNVIRGKGNVPCVVYGHKVEKLMIQCSIVDLHKALEKAGESAIVELDVDGKTIPVLFKQVDFHPVSDREIHADFLAVNMDKEIETLVPVHFEGEAPAVKTLGGIFVVVHDHVRVRCLPAKLPRSLTAKVDTLEQFHDSLSVAKIKVPDGIRIMDEPTAVLAIIQEPRKEEVIAPVATAVAAEGAAAPADGAAPAAGAPGAAPAAEAQAKEKAAAPKK